MLEIKNLNVSVDDKIILHDFNLTINDGEIHALMGPNGVGKSTICKTIMGDKNYHINNGTIIYNNEILNDMETTKRARLGIFLLNQNPIAIEGVSNSEMLRMALSEKNNKQVDIFKFNNKMIDICKKIDLPISFIHRNINEGMSGGERKKNELLHLWMLEPSLIILDEVDSGLDVDALKLVSKSIMEYYSLYKPIILIITHHEEILELIKPQYVHVLKDGSIMESGNIDLAKKIEKNGFNGQTK